MFDTDQQALTELGLALSMAFFSLFVIALLSTHVTAEDRPGAITMQDETGARPMRDDETLLIWYDDRLMDHQLKPLEPTELTFDRDVVLALSPATSLNDVISLRRQIKAPNLSITALDDNWLTRLNAR